MLFLYRSLCLHKRVSWHFLIVRPLYPMTDDSWCARMFFNLENAAIYWQHPSVILHINPCGLFIVKSCLYMYIWFVSKLFIGNIIFKHARVPLFAQFQILLFKISNSIHQVFFIQTPCLQLYGFKSLIKSIPRKIEQFYLTYRWDPNRYNHLGAQAAGAVEYTDCISAEE